MYHSPTKVVHRRTYVQTKFHWMLTNKILIVSEALISRGNGAVGVRQYVLLLRSFCKVEVRYVSLRGAVMGR